MSKIKNSRLDQNDTEPFEQQQFGTAGAKGVNTVMILAEAAVAKINVAPVSFSGLCGLDTGIRAERFQGIPPFAFS